MESVPGMFSERFEPSQGRRTALDRDAFAARLAAAAPALWTVAAAVLGDRGRAEDVVQEAALIALGKLERFDPRTSFSAWMGAIVRNVARNEARKRGRQATQALPPEHVAEYSDARAARSPGDASPAPATLGGLEGALALEESAFDDEVRAALLELRPVARAALLLRTVQGLDYQEIAALLAIRPGTAMSHVHRAREALRERLGRTRESTSPRQSSLARPIPRGGAA